jgi:hypothetical protein
LDKGEISIRNAAGKAGCYFIFEWIVTLSPSFIETTDELVLLLERRRKHLVLERRFVVELACHVDIVQLHVLLEGQVAVYGFVLEQVNFLHNSLEQLVVEYCWVFRGTQRNCV